MRYSGITCPVCEKQFEENDDVVVCPLCATPHHRECWKQTGRCINEEKHGEDFKWKFPERTTTGENATDKGRETGKDRIVFKNGESAVVCSECGALNYGNDAFCLRCKKPLKRENTAADSLRGDIHYNAINPERLAYDNMRLYGGLEPNILIDGIPVAEISDYIGGAQPGRIIRRMATMERFERKFSFSFAAFIFGPLWFFYRKMYKIGALILAALTLCGTLSLLCILTPEYAAYCKDTVSYTYQAATGEITEEEFQKLISDAEIRFSENNSLSTARRIFSEIFQYIRWLISFGCAFIADSLYRKKIKKDVAQIRREAFDMASYRTALNLKGGTSALGALIGVALYAAALFIEQLPLLIAIMS